MAGGRGNIRWMEDDDVPSAARAAHERTVLEASTFRTWEVVMSCPTREARDAVLGELAAASLVVEDWTESLTLMCDACSHGDSNPDSFRNQNLNLA